MQVAGLFPAFVEALEKVAGAQFVKIGRFVSIERAALQDWFRTFTIKRRGKNNG